MSFKASSIVPNPVKALLSKFPFAPPEKQNSVRSVDSGGTTDSADSTDTIDDANLNPPSDLIEPSDVDASRFRIPFLRQSATSSRFHKVDQVPEEPHFKTAGTPVLPSTLTIETSTSISSSSSSSSSSKVDAFPIQQEEILLRQQRERLLHLRHASRCQFINHPRNPTTCNTATTCPMSPYCHKLKLLWQHMVRCHNDYCQVSLCASSRYLLSHYAACHNEDCGLCVPLKVLYKRGLSEKELLSSPIPSSKKVRKSNSRDSIMLMKVVNELSSRGITIGGSGSIAGSTPPKGSPAEQKSTKEVAKSLLTEDTDSDDDEYRSHNLKKAQRVSSTEVENKAKKEEEEEDLSVLLQQLQLVDSPTLSSSSSSSSAMYKHKKPIIEPSTTSKDPQAMLHKVFQIIDHIQQCQGQCSLGKNCSRTKKLLLHYRACQQRHNSSSTITIEAVAGLQNDRCTICPKIHAVLTLHHQQRQVVPASNDQQLSNL